MNIFLSISFNICLLCSKGLSHWDGSFEYQQPYVLVVIRKSNFNYNFECKIVNIFNICFGCLKGSFNWDSSFECPQHIFWLRNKKTKFLFVCWCFTSKSTIFQSYRDIFLSSCIKLPFVIKIFVLSIFEWLFYTSLSVPCSCSSMLRRNWQQIWFKLSINDMFYYFYTDEERVMTGYRKYRGNQVITF